MKKGKVKRIHIIEMILDQYENSDREYWRMYPNLANDRTCSIRITQEIYDEIGRSELNTQVLQLQEEKLLKDGRSQKDSGWLIRGTELEKIRYSLKDICKFYEREGRIPKYTLEEEPRRVLLEEIRELLCLSWKPWIARCLKGLEDDLQNGRMPEICQNKKKLYFDTLKALNGLDESMYKRIFSKRYLGSSKKFENEIQSQIIRDARKYHDDVEDDEEVMGNDEVLEQILIDTYHQELSIKGELRFKLREKLVDTSSFSYGIILNADTMKYAVILPEQKIQRVITVENKANFMSMPYEEGTLLIYTHGFFTPKEREFLVRLQKYLCVKRVEFYHTGDLDYGGIRIFQHIQKKVFSLLKPLWMDQETFFKYAQWAEERDDSYLKKVEQMEVLACMKEVKACILETGCTIEQECMLY